MSLQVVVIDYKRRNNIKAWMCRSLDVPKGDIPNFRGKRYNCRSDGKVHISSDNCPQSCSLRGGHIDRERVNLYNQYARGQIEVPKSPIPEPSVEVPSLVNPELAKRKAVRGLRTGRWLVYKRDSDLTAEEIKYLLSIHWLKMSNDARSRLSIDKSAHEEAKQIRDKCT